MRRVISSTACSLLLLLAVFNSGCEPEPTLPVHIDDLAEYMLHVPSGGEAIFRYDSTTYDPDLGGTSRRRASGTWAVSSDSSGIDMDDSREFFAVKSRDSSGMVVATFSWIWRLLPNQLGVTNTIGGIEYLSLTRPLRLGATWNALLYTDPELVVSVEGEPVRIHTNWKTRVDSLGLYILPDGREVDAVWVTYADSELFIELRRVQEVYGRGIGLLERHVEFLDTQRPPGGTFQERAERGFTLDLIRLR